MVHAIGRSIFLGNVHDPLLALLDFQTDLVVGLLRYAEGEARDVSLVAGKIAQRLFSQLHGFGVKVLHRQALHICARGEALLRYRVDAGTVLLDNAEAFKQLDRFLRLGDTDRREDLPGQPTVVILEWCKVDDGTDYQMVPLREELELIVPDGFRLDTEGGSLKSRMDRPLY